MKQITVKTDRVSITIPDLPKEGASKLNLTFHWSAGTYHIGEAETSHYHFIIGEKGNVVQGINVEKNCVYNGHPRQPGYAAHVKNSNSNNIAISAASMSGSAETEARKGHYGPYPMTKEQVESMIEVAALLCYTYGIPVLHTRILGHEEWDSVMGHPQDRWDVNCIPHLDIRPEKTGNGTYTATNYLRSRVKARVEELMKGSKPKPEVSAQLIGDIVEAQRALYASLNTLPLSEAQRQAAEAALNDYNRVLHEAGLKA